MEEKNYNNSFSAMSEQPIHTNPWAEKLQEVSLPEPAEAKQQLFQLLDKETPPRRDYRRWVLLIILLLLLLGVCNCPGRARLNRHPVAVSSLLPVATGDNAGGNPAVTAVEKHSAGREEKQQQSILRYIKQARPVPVLTTGSSKKQNTARAGKKIMIQQANGMEPTEDVTTATGSFNTLNTLPHTDTLATAPGSSPQADTLLKTDTLPKADTLLKKTSDKMFTDSIPIMHAKHPQKGWAFAAGLDQSFPLGSQQRVNGGNGIGNYIPVPQLRYHFNDKWYVQLELAVNAPQYTRPLLLQQQSDTMVGARLLRQVSLKKLSYLQAPLGLYYSPVKNGYIGAGIRTGRLHDALGLYESRIRRNGLPDSIVSSKTQSLKKDSALLYQSFRATDWQWYAELNYHYGPLSMGIRYNQSLGSYITTGLPVVQAIKAANSSLQLNIRYTIWRQRPKKNLAVK